MPLKGAPELVLEAAPRTDRVALLAPDFRPLKLRPMVEEGAVVEAGTPVLQDKADDNYVLTAPVSGKVVAVNRGERRLLLGLEIEPDGRGAAKQFTRYDAARIANLPREEVLAQVLGSGTLPYFHQRPFNYVAVPGTIPRDIFISSFDSAPFGLDENLVLKGREQEFQAGLDVCTRLTSGKVHLSLNASRSDLSPALTGAQRVELHRFQGPHPAGNVGVQIHHIKPIRNRHDVVWTIGIQEVAALGKLFLTGQLDSEQIVAVAGSAATNARYFKTLRGARISSFLQGKVAAGDVRHIAGNVLSGRQVTAAQFMGFYDRLLTLIPEATEPEFMGWTMPGLDKLSFYPLFLSRLFPGKKYAPTTALNGGVRAFIVTGKYEEVLPMNILPMFLFRSILVGDIREMEGLGIYELAEEDVALCEFVCPSKVELQKLVRQGLNLIETET